MARTTNEFGGQEIVPSIESITGVQAPVQAEFVSALSTIATNPTLSAADITALQAMTVNNEHGQRRSIQNPKNNLKNSLGIERITFDSINELDTEFGSDLATTPSFNRPVHALTEGESRIRFVGTGWLVNANNDGTDVRTDILNDYIEVTFYGTGLNLLGRIDTGSDWQVSVDGGTAFNMLPITGTIATGVYNGKNIKPNTVLPAVAGLTAGIHTVRISRANTNTLFLNGCEIVNVSSTISTQPGADFDGRVAVTAVEATDGFPIKPTAATAGTAFTGTTGARVLNYASAGGALKQVFTEAIENVVEAGGQGTTYTVQLSTPGTTGTLTIPTGASSIRVITFGGGGSGGNVGSPGSGGGGGGGARAEVVYTRNAGNTGTLALTSDIGAANGTTTASLAGTQVVAAGGGSSGNGSSAGPGGTPNVPTTDPGITGWTRSSTAVFNGLAGNTAGGGAGAEAGGVGGNTGGGLAGRRGLTPLFPLTETSEIAGRAEGSGGGQTSVGDPQSTVDGAIPGGGGSGNTAGNNPPQGTGARGETYIIYTLATAANPVTNGTFTSAAAEEIGTPRDTFSNADHTNQEVIRRINFREFGINTEFAILPTGGNNAPAFTLDDGTTTLVGQMVVQTAGAVGMYGNSVNSNPALETKFILTFVGTGLDIVTGSGSLGSGATASYEVSVDGFVIGTLPITASSVSPIVSGLAYGTHTVQFRRNLGGTVVSVQDFIIYGPRKPEIPVADAGSVELAEYNVMADFSPTVSSATDIVDRLRIGKGTLRKMCTREMLFTGAFSGFTSDPAAISGEQINQENGNEPILYAFYGTGLEMRWSSRDSKSYQFFIDQPTAAGQVATPLTLTAANFFSENSDDSQTFVIGNSAAGTLGGATVPATTDGQATVTGAGTLNNSGFRVTGLPLGFHTIAVMGRDSSLAFRPRCFDIITPIHINDDTLKIGSEGLSSLVIDPVIEEDGPQPQNFGEAKAWAAIDGTSVSGLILSSHNISAYIRGGTGNYTIYFDRPFKDADYVAIGTPTGGGNDSLDFGALKTPNSIRVEISNSGSTNVDERFNIVFYGELIDE